MPIPPPFKLPFKPRRIVLFAGHVVDAPDREEARLTPAMAKAAVRPIEDALTALALGPSDFAITQGAAGGDIVFGELCLARGVPLQLLLPLPEEEFIAASIAPSIDAAEWEGRYREIAARSWRPPCVMPQAPGDVFERCNVWMIATAKASGARDIDLVCLWDGTDGAGPGGTAHMVAKVKAIRGGVSWIDTRTLA